MRPDIEQALAGMALRDGSVVGITGLSPDNFQGRIERLIWEAVGDLTAGGTLPDSVSVSDWIHERHNLSCGSEVGRILREAPTPAGAEHYAKRLRSEDVSDQLASLATRLAGDASADERIADAMQTLMNLSASGQKRTSWLHSHLGAVVDDLDGKNCLPTVSTGFLDIDKLLGGLHGGDLIVVAARPSMGKTAFGVNLLRHATEKGHVVGMVSGEQGAQQIAQRMLALRGDISLARMRRRALEDGEWTRVMDSMRVVKDYRMLIDDSPRPKLADCASVARSWKHAHKLELLLVDYLQLVQATGDGFRLQVGEVAQGLKALARELEIPVVVLAQVKREVESRPIGDGMGRLPHMGDIAESSIIEQAADQILTLYRPAVYADCAKEEGEAWINIAKNRHGPTGLIPITWRADSLRFENGGR